MHLPKDIFESTSILSCRILLRIFTFRKFQFDWKIPGVNPCNKKGFQLTFSTCEIGLQERTWRLINTVDCTRDSCFDIFPQPHYLIFHPKIGSGKENKRKEDVPAGRNWRYDGGVTKSFRCGGCMMKIDNSLRTEWSIWKPLPIPHIAFSCNVEATTAAIRVHIVGGGGFH